MILTIILILLIILIAIWLFGFFITNDFSVKSVTDTELNKIKKILVVFPHPDDEVLTCGGLIHRLSKKGVQSTLFVLTKGEKGTPDGKEDMKLKDIRSSELKESAKILRYNNLIQLDLGDGDLHNKKTIVKNVIEKQILKSKPDLIITYDQSGLYGHPDHITVSQAVTELCQKNGIKLWFSAVPDKIFRMAKLPVQMAEDKNFVKDRSKPNIKYFIGTSSFTMLSAMKVHKSQFYSSKKFTFEFFQTRLFAILPLHEYFHEVR